MTLIVSRSTDAQTVIPTLVLDRWESENEPASKIHKILGRPDVDVTLRPAHDRTGTLGLLFWDAAAAEAARKFFTAPAVFTTTGGFAWVPAAFVPNGSIRPAQQDNRSRWVLTVPYQELSL